MLSSLYFFQESFSNIVTITFTALIITELLNVYSEVSLILILTFLDKQTKLENGHLSPIDIRSLCYEHCTATPLFRYILHNMAILFESACYYSDVMDASTCNKMDHY